jgi:spore maturation protein SpmA/spore maturation protein SpmB
MINRIWLGLFALAFAAMLGQIIHGDWDVLSRATTALFSSAKMAVDIALGLVGLLCLWLGILKIGERAGLVHGMGRAVEPFFRWLIPDMPKSHPAFGHMAFNMAANALGLDNAATPAGLAAMRSLQALNPSDEEASKAQSLFIVLNASSLTIFPVTIFLYRAQMGAADPADVFLPILISTGMSTLVGLIAVGLWLRLPLWQPRVMLTLGGIAVLLAGLLAGLSRLDAEGIARWSSLLGNGLLLALLLAVGVLAARRKVNAFDAFIDGAREGFDLALKILPYLVAMLVAIGLLRASGALGWLTDGMRAVTLWLGVDGRFVDALPTALMKPLSGSGARAMMLDLMGQVGADAFPARVAAVVQGSTETTLYVLALYLGSVGLRRARGALMACLLSDVAGIVTAITVSYLFFGHNA